MTSAGAATSSGARASDRPREMVVDLDALAHNYRAIRELVGAEVEIVPALKGNAYGHGAGPVARRLAELGVRRFATGSLADALAIRSASADAQVVIFGGPLPDGLPQLVAHGFTPTVYDMAGARAVSRAAARPTGVCVKVDAGLGRLGVALADAFEFVRQIRSLDHLVVEGVYTHLPFAFGSETGGSETGGSKTGGSQDAPGLAWARERLARFDELLDALASAGIELGMTQALASSAILAGLSSRATAVSPGQLLFGLAAPPGFRPVLDSIRSWLIHVHAPGPASGFGGAGTATRVGVVPVGLVDGYPSLPPASGARALIGGCSVPVLGASLEYVSLDLSGFERARVGDEVLLLGRSGDDEIAIHDLAAWSGTLAYRLLVSLDRRIPCRYLPDA